MHSSVATLPPISFRCPSCNARLKAARQLLGQICPCPRCAYRVTVRLALPSDADVALVEDFLPGQSSRLR